MAAIGVRLQDLHLSALVVQEAGRGEPEQVRLRQAALAPFALLSVDDDARKLAEAILTAQAVPAEYPEDALHIAVAAVNGMELLVTWNFAHLNNPFTRLLVREAVENTGYRCPEICSPEELLEERP